MDELVAYVALGTAIDGLIQAVELADGDPKARRDALRKARAARAELAIWLEGTGAERQTPYVHANARTGRL